METTILIVIVVSHLVLTEGDLALPRILSNVRANKNEWECHCVRCLFFESFNFKGIADATVVGEDLIA